MPVFDRQVAAPAREAAWRGAAAPVPIGRAWACAGLLWRQGSRGRGWNSLSVRIAGMDSWISVLISGSLRRLGRIGCESGWQPDGESEKRYAIGARARGVDCEECEVWDMK